MAPRATLRGERGTRWIARVEPPHATPSRPVRAGSSRFREQTHTEWRLLVGPNGGAGRSPIPHEQPANKESTSLHADLSALPIVYVISSARASVRGCAIHAVEIAQPRSDFRDRAQRASELDTSDATCTLRVDSARALRLRRIGT